MTDLKPCKFCGGEIATVRSKNTIDGYVKWVQCKFCEAHGPISKTDHTAAKAWNSSAPTNKGVWQ